MIQRYLIENVVNPTMILYGVVQKNLHKFTSKVRCLFWVYQFINTVINSTSSRAFSVKPCISTRGLDSIKLKKCASELLEEQKTGKEMGARAINISSQTTRNYIFFVILFQTKVVVENFSLIFSNKNKTI